MLRIAVFLEKRLEAGANRYELTVARLLHAHRTEAYQFVFVVGDEASRAVLDSLGVGPVVVTSQSVVAKAHRFLSRGVLGFRLFKALGLQHNNLDRLLTREAIDLAYFLGPSATCKDLSEHSFILTVWDLSHRDAPEFPEVGWAKEFEARELFYTRYLKKAFAVSVDSHLGKRNAVRRYCIEEERVHVLQFLPPNVFAGDTAKVDIRAKHGIVGEYVFYPAQFWAHKNHIYILDALRILRDEHGVEMQAVFTGADMGNLAYILAKAREFGLERQVRYLGFVDAEDIPELYRQSLALVMPSYFGPANLPPLEAFSLDCPVCYPDHPNIDDYIREATFALDLDDPATLVRHLLAIRSQPALVAEHVERGRQVLADWTGEDFWNALEPIFASFAIRRRTWGAGLTR